ncbi:MAG: lipopolysaccharide kinase InaA family protein, partial [Planctomycetota bacterium]
MSHLSILGPFCRILIGVEKSNALSQWSWEFDRSEASVLQGVLELWDELEDYPGAAVLKSNLSRTVIALPGESNHPGLVIKRYHVRGLGERLKYLCLPSRAAIEWQALHQLRSGGVRVPRPIAFGEARAGGVLQAAGLVMERIPEARPLPLMLESHSQDSPLRREILWSIGEMLGRLHELGVQHTDLHAGNFLVQEGDAPLPYLVDLHAVRIGAWLPEPVRRAGLARFFHSLQGCLGFHEARLLLEGYQKVAALPGWEEVSVETILEDLEKRARRLEEIRLHSRSKRCWKTSSEFVKEDVGGWRIHRRREIPLAALRPLMKEPIPLEPIYKERPGHRVGVAALQVGSRSRPVVVKTRKVRNIWKVLLYRFYPGPLER